jgi:formate C-acetyltransferase
MSIQTSPLEKLTASARLLNLKRAVTTSPYSICIERAMLITEYFKDQQSSGKHILIQKAEALSHVLTNKTCCIYPNELIVGSTTSKRVAGPLYPELHGLPVMEDLLQFTSRETNPLQISHAEKIMLVKAVAPFWLNKFLAYKSFSGRKLLNFIFDQLNPKFYLINETGGIGHLIPDYNTLIQKGINHIIKQAEQHLLSMPVTDKSYHFLRAVIIVCNAVIQMAENYAQHIFQLADNESDEDRKYELLKLARILRHVPANPAGNLHEALQSIWMLHTAITLEGLGISLGRMDQTLFSFYENDIQNGTITRQQAKELIGCFVIKTAEIIPVFSTTISKSHGGFLSGQALTIGGMDKNGNDVTNELSYIFLELMDEVRMRQPNYHARIHVGSSTKYIDKIMELLSKGVNSPAVYNDELIIRSLKKCGMTDADAKDYSTLGCVELSAAGKTFGSTDAALVNVPVCMEMALNKGKLFGSSAQHGFKTATPETFQTIDDVKDAFRQQLQFIIHRLHQTLTPIELGNRDFHPTPLSSAFIHDCIENGKDVTAGGAHYNFSGVQGVGITDAADSIHAIDVLVFKTRQYTMAEIVKALKNNFKGAEKLRTAMLNVPKFGNDNDEADACSKWVADVFYDCFEGLYNTRGGKFVAGYYSTTTHYAFGLLTGALPNGRMKGTPFTSGIAPTNGMDVKGPTALFNSITKIDFERAHNGVNVNAKFDTATLKGAHGKEILKALLLTYFKKGGMQAQLNVLDTEMLKDAKLHPEKYPSLIVRVSGYSAYFNDLSPAMKDEIIQRSTLLC